ncbi:MAG: hypothetical protein AAB555_02570 [Patescibacteria group bacterium]
MTQNFACLEDTNRVQKAKQTLEDAVAGKKVSEKRLKAAQDFLLELLEELNAKRSRTPVRCGGNVTRSQLAVDIADSR